MLPVPAMIMVFVEWASCQARPTCDGVTPRSAAISMTAGMSVTFGRES